MRGRPEPRGVRAGDPGASQDGDPLRAVLARTLLGRFDPTVRRTLVVDVTATTLVATFGGVTAPFAGLVLRREFDATPFQLSLAASAGAASMVLSLAWARFAAHHSRAWVVWPGVIGRALLLLTPLAGSAWAFTVLLSMSTFVVTAAVPANAALVERIYPRVARGRALACVRAAGAAAGVGVSIAAGVVLETFGFRGAFVVAAAVGVAANLVLLALRVPAVADAPGTSDPTPPPMRQETRGLNANRAFSALKASAFLFGLGCWIQVPARPVTLADVVKVTPTELGWLGAIAGLAAIAGSITWGRLADRRSSLDALRLVDVAGVAATLVYLTASSPWGLAGGFIADGLVGSGIELVWIVALIDVAGSAPGRSCRRGLRHAGGVRGLIGPPLGALLVEQAGVNAVYVVAGALMVVGLVVLTRVAHVPAGAPLRDPAPAASLVR